MSKDQFLSENDKDFTRIVQLFVDISAVELFCQLLVYISLNNFTFRVFEKLAAVC